MLKKILLFVMGVLLLFWIELKNMFDQSQQPDMGESIDYSRLGDTVEDCWNAAEQFLSERMRSGLYFEVVTADQ